MSTLEGAHHTGPEPQRPDLVSLGYRVLQPVVNGLERVGATADAVTWTSLVLCSAAGVAIMIGAWWPAALLMLVGGVCDAVDGQLARKGAGASRRGAFLDSFVDRLSDAALFGGFVMYGVLHSPLIAFAALLGLTGAFGTSYARARAGSLRVDAKVGWMQRPGRVINLLAVVVLAALADFIAIDASSIVLAGLSFAAIATMTTALHRASWVLTALAKE